MAYDLTVKNIITTPSTIVKDMTNEDCVIFLDMLSLLSKDGEKLMRDKAFNSSVERVAYTLPNGKKRIVTVVRGSETSVTKPETNWTKTFDNALKFAKENGFKIPYKEPEIDYNKLQSMDWFQENVDKFVVKEEKTRTTKSSNSIRGKYVE